MTHCHIMARNRFCLCKMIKNGPEGLKICRVAKFSMGSSIVKLTFQIDDIFIKYSCNDDMLSFLSFQH